MRNNFEDKVFEEKVFEGKKFIGVEFEDYTFEECTFIGCVFEECKIINTRVINCEFINCNIIVPESRHSEVKSTSFKKCNLVGVNWRMFIPFNKYAHIFNELKECVLKYNNFLDLNLSKYNFSDNIIQESTFEECDLRESKFKNARLDGTQFIKSDLRKCDFREARGYVVDIKTSQVKEARFSFPEVVALLDSLEIKID